MLLGNRGDAVSASLPRLTTPCGTPPCSVRMKPSIPSLPRSSVNNHSPTSTSESGPPRPSRLSLPGVLSLQTPEHRLRDLISYNLAKQKMFSFFTGDWKVSWGSNKLPDFFHMRMAKWRCTSSGLVFFAAKPLCCNTCHGVMSYFL